MKIKISYKNFKIALVLTALFSMSLAVYGALVLRTFTTDQFGYIEMNVELDEYAIKDPVRIKFKSNKDINTRMKVEYAVKVNKFNVQGDEWKPFFFTKVEEFDVSGKKADIGLQPPFSFIRLNGKVDSQNNRQKTSLSDLKIISIGCANPFCF